MVCVCVCVRRLNAWRGRKKITHTSQGNMEMFKSVTVKVNLAMTGEE